MMQIWRRNAKKRTWQPHCPRASRDWQAPMVSAYGVKKKPLLLIPLSAQQNVMRITTSTSVSSASGPATDGNKAMRKSGPGIRDFKALALPADNKNEHTLLNKRFSIECSVVISPLKAGFFSPLKGGGEIISLTPAISKWSSYP